MNSHYTSYSVAAVQNIDSIPSTETSSICSTLGEAICSLDEDNKHTEAIHALVARAAKLMPNTLSTAAQPLIDTEYDVDSADFVADVILSDVLTTAVGKQSLKLLYNYLKYNGEWLLHRMNVSDIEISEFKSFPGQNIKEEKSHLLQSMFHIGHRPFDQVHSQPRYKPIKIKRKRENKHILCIYFYILNRKSALVVADNLIQFQKYIKILLLFLFFLYFISFENK